MLRFVNRNKSNKKIVIIETKRKKSKEVYGKEHKSPK